MPVCGSYCITPALIASISMSWPVDDANLFAAPCPSLPVNVLVSWPLGEFVGGRHVSIASRDGLEALGNATTEIALVFGFRTEADCRTTRGETTTRILLPFAPLTAGFCRMTAPPSSTRVCAVPT